MKANFITRTAGAIVALFVLTRFTAGKLASQHYQQKADFFRHYQTRPGDIVFVGDSITDGACWDEVFPGLPIKNRGINADTISGVLNRLNNIVAGQPAAIFLLIGTNDLPWYAQESDNNIFTNYEAILKRIQSESKETKIFIQSILPRHRRYARHIKFINKKLEDLARLYNCTYINLYPHFSTPDGRLRPEFTNDQLHLLAAGYARWAEILTPYLEKLKPADTRPPAKDIKKLLNPVRSRTNP
jgi:lysophospholipase L1-like esterase